MLSELFWNLDSLREFVFGLIFTLIAFWIGRESANNRKRELQRGFLRQLLALQAAISELANDDNFWKATVDKSQAEPIFRPLRSLMNSINSAAGDAGIAADIPDLDVALQTYTDSFNDFVAAWSDYQRRAKGYKERNDKLIEALIALARRFDWRVRWGLIQPLRNLKLTEVRSDFLWLFKR